MKTNTIIHFIVLVMAVVVFAARSSADDGYWEAGWEVNGIVNAVAVYGNDVYVGGSFTKAGAVNATNIAKWNGSSWSALGSGVNNQVYAIAVYGNTVYAGGKFTQAGSVPVNFIAKWDGSSWSALGGLNNGVGGYVYALAITQSGPLPQLYVGGVFGSVVKSDGSLLTVNYIARWIGNSWYTVGGGVNSTVYGITLDGTTVYVGGEFTIANYFSWSNLTDHVAANHIAKWNGSWSALTDTFSRNGVNGRVYSVAVNGSDVYVGGSFTDRGNNIARFDGSVPLWRALGTGVNGYVSSMGLSGTKLYVGGGFMQAGGTSANYIARWDGNNWATLGSGLNSSADALRTRNGHIYVGGGFGTAGGMPSPHFGVWHEQTESVVPVLRILHTPRDTVLLAWPAAATGYSLEQNADLSTGNWQPVTTPPVVVGTENQVTLPATPPRNFFRLRSP